MRVFSDADVIKDLSALEPFGVASRPQTLGIPPIRLEHPRCFRRFSALLVRRTADIIRGTLKQACAQYVAELAHIPVSLKRIACHRPTRIAGALAPAVP